MAAFLTIKTNQDGTARVDNRIVLDADECIPYGGADAGPDIGWTRNKDGGWEPPTADDMDNQNNRPQD